MVNFFLLNNIIVIIFKFDSNKLIIKNSQLQTLEMNSFKKI
jgi:hypothetical protein